MTEEEAVQTEVPVLSASPEPDYQPEPEATVPPMEVIPVDELLDRIAELLAEKDAASEDVEDLPEAEDPVVTVDGDVDIDLPAADPVTAIVEHLLDMIVDLGKIEKHTRETSEYMEIVAQTLDHPALTTSFEDYTVSEALLLFLLLSVFLAACARMLRGGLSWLRS